ncbi:MAG: tetratricopeptide repeat protein [bacterium]
MKNRGAGGLVLALAALLLFQGCVYFNTFYLARRNFEEAEAARLRAEQEDSQIPRDVPQKYSKSLQFASKVLAEHPDSKWAEEALLISQKVLFRQGEYAASTRKGYEMLNTFSEAEQVPEARLYLAMWVLELGSPADAEQEANRAAEALQGRLRAEARLTAARAQAERDLVAGAAATLRELAADPATPADIALRARRAEARMMEELGRLEEAVSIIDEVLASEYVGYSAALELAILQVDLELRADRLEEAAGRLERLEDLDSDGWYAGLRRYFRARMLARQGQKRKAQEEMVFALRDGVTAAWESRIRMDLARLLEETGNFISAYPEYQSVASGRGEEELKQEAARRAEAILRFYSLRSLASREEETLDFPDPRDSQTARGPGAPDRAPRGGVRERGEMEVVRGRPPSGRFDPEQLGEGIAPVLTVEQDVPPGWYVYLLAEHLALEMGQPDSAMTYLGHLTRNHPSSELVPRACLAMTEWTSDSERGRRFRERGDRRLREEFADTRWGYHYLRSAGEDPSLPESIRGERALDEVQAGWSLFAGREEKKELIEGMEEVAERYPGTEAARRAALARAVLLEDIAPPDSARTAYQQVADRHEGTREGAAARARLQGQEIPDGFLSAAHPPRIEEIQAEMTSWKNWMGQRKPAQVTLVTPGRRTVPGRVGGTEAIPGRPETGGRPPTGGNRPPPGSGTVIPPETRPH